RLGVLSGSLFRSQHDPRSRASCSSMTDRRSSSGQKDYRPARRRVARNLRKSVTSAGDFRLPPPPPPLPRCRPPSTPGRRKHEVGSTKSEIRNPKQIRSTNVSNTSTGGRLRHFELRASNLFRISCFGFRISCFAAESGKL